MRTNQVKLLIIVGAIGLVVAISAYRLALNIENNNTRSKVRVHATTLAAQLVGELDRKFEVLYGLQALFNASVHVDSDEFALAAEAFLSRDAALEGLEWVPKVEHNERAAYEQAAQERIPGFQIKDSAAAGSYVAAKQAEAYYPIYYLEPSTVYRSARGLNLASYRPSWVALQRARDSGDLVVSDVLSEVRGESPFSLIFAVLPVYKTTPLTLEERRDTLEGFVVGLFRSAQVIGSVVSGYRSDELIITIEALAADQSKSLVYPMPENSLPRSASSFVQQLVIPLQNEKWILTVEPTLAGEALLRSNTPIWVFILVLVFTTVGSIIIGVLVRQRELISDAVVERTGQLNLANERLEKLSNTDFLTGLANRRHFELMAEKAWRHAAETGERIAVVMIDVDHFKLYNDHFGHLAGDICLKRVANVLRREIGRNTEMLARYGGEEFIALLAGEAATSNNAARVLLAIREQYIAHAPSAAHKVVTASIGVAWLGRTPAASLDHLITAADDALYQAKALGRDQMVEVEYGSKTDSG